MQSQQSSYRTNSLIQRAGQLFEWLWFKGKIKAFIAKWTQESRLIPYLSYDLIDQYKIEVEHIGLRPIRVSDIIGTMGRMNYDKDFYPLQHRDKKRWMSVAIAIMSSSITLDPISVIQFNDKYYTSDGNHRVSVARSLNKLYIDGNVIVWRSTLPDNNEE